MIADGVDGGKRGFDAVPRSRGRSRRWATILLLTGLGLAAAGCSIRSLAVNALANSLAASGDVFASDEDPELIRDALPFALKTLETLLEEKPEHRGLLLASCRGFTQYAFAFVEPEAERLEETDWAAAEEGRQRALRLYLRARDYCLRALDLEVPGVLAGLLRATGEGLTGLEREHVPLLYWTGAAWGSAISLGKDRPELLADWPAVSVLMERALELDERWGHGAIHGVMITVEGRSEAMGGSPERARRHFERAVELSGGRSAGPFVSLAEAVSVPAQDWREYEDLLRRALAVDPDEMPSARVENLVVQRRARWLLGRIGDVFLDYGEPEES